MKTPFVLSIAFLSYVGIQAQGTSAYYPMTPNNGDVLLATPEVSAFQKYNYNNVNLYTGKVDVSIPIYEIKTGNIVVPIEITYNSGGIKVDEIATSVGIGWNVNAGGSVLRTIKDIDDNEIELSPNTYTSSWTTDEFTNLTIPNPFRKTYVNKKGYLAEYTDLNLTNPPLTLPSGTGTAIDASPDLFVANAPGLNSKFFLNNLNRGNPTDFQNNVSTFTMKFIDGSGTKGATVTRKRLSNSLPSNGFGFNYNLKPMDYENFELTNTNGLKYTFGSTDISEFLPSYYSPTMIIAKQDPWAANGISYQSNALYNSLMAKGLYRLKVSAWNLDKIVDPQNNKSITYEYDKYNKPTKQTFRTNIQTALLDNAMPFRGGANYYTGQKCTYDFIPDYITPPSPGDPPTPDECQVKNSHLDIKYPENNRIKSIKWDNGNVKFYYDLNRLDALDEKALTKIEIIINDRVTKTYFFNYSYFASKENCSDWQCKRLKLESVDIKNSEETQSKRYYTFEYNYSHPLPKVNSLQQDFLGYYNNHGVELEPIDMHIHPQIQKSPTLYYTALNGKYAIVPFNPMGGVELIPGDYSLDANEYSLTGLLKKVTNPLGGFNEFEYENNEFKYANNNLKAGGARIKTQIINDGKKERYLYYKYSEGQLINIPTYGYPLGHDRAKKDLPNNTSFVIYTTNRADVQLTNGAYIGYSKVIQEEEGKGYTKFEFSNERNEEVQHINPIPGYYTCEYFLHRSSAYGKNNFIDNDILRGKILSEKTYDKNNNLLKEVFNGYTRNIFEEIAIPFQQTLYQPQHSYTQQAYNLPRVDNLAQYNYINKLRVERNLNTSKSVVDHLSPTVTMSNYSSYEYDPIYPFIKKEKEQLTNEYSYIEKNYTYPFDTTNQFLTDANLLESPLSIEKKFVKKNDYSDIGITTLQGKESFVYSKNTNTSNLIQPTAKIRTNLDNSQSTESTYDRYDSKGNLLQYTSSDGVATVLIWGYKQSMPIAKIKGVTYEQVMQKFGLNSTDNQAYLNLDIVGKSNMDNSELTEQDLVKSLLNFRTTLNLSDNQISTYTFNPGIGITNIISSSGIKESYKYNAQDKLNKILGSDGKTVKEYSYNQMPLSVQTIFYNRKYENLFTRNNCQSGYIAEQYNYIVPAGTFSSNISLADANQKALNDIQQNGQNIANTNASCIPQGCSFTPESNIQSVTSTVEKLSLSYVKVRVNIPISSNTSVNWEGFLLGEIGNTCKLQSFTNVLVTSENGRTWRVLMSNNGKLFLQLLSGTVNSGYINLDFQYNINDTNALRVAPPALP